MVISCEDVVIPSILCLQEERSSWIEAITYTSSGRPSQSKEEEREKDNGQKQKYEGKLTITLHLHTPPPYLLVQTLK